MVPRLRVAVRVISEDEYLNHLSQGPPGPGLYRGEKKFPVVIPNPQQWQIGHLVAEIKRQFKHIYGRDIGTIKCISHGFDDCQLHKDLSVFEHLYDEGRAKMDAGDQYVVVKAVYLEGGPLREGSVLPDFDDPSYENRPIPPVPVPSWSDASPKSGKRFAEEYDDQDFRANNLPDIKRQRLNDIEDVDNNEDVAQSVEQDVQMQAVEAAFPTSQTVILDSQSSSQDEQLHSARQQSLPTSRPASLRHSRNAPSEKAISSATRLKADDSIKNHAELPLPTSRKQLLYDRNHGKAQPLLTPPSDASKKTSSGETRPPLMPVFKKKSSPAPGTNSGLQRPSAVKSSNYDMDDPEDIECSLMSPKSKLAMNKKFPRSSSGSKSSHSRKEKDTPDRHRGTVPHSEIVKLMKDGRSIQADPSARSRPGMTRNSPENNFTADEDGYSRRSHVLQIQNARVAASQNAERITGPLTAFSKSNDNVQLKSISNNTKNDVDMNDEANASNQPTAYLGELDDTSEDSASLASRRSSVSARRKLTMTTESGTVPVSKEPADTPAAAEMKRRRKRKSRIDDDEAIVLLNVDTTRPQLDTEQSTPVDSPGEQLLEMQASSRKSGPHSQPNDSEKAEKQTRTKQEKQKRRKQEKMAGVPKKPPADSGRTMQQKPKLDQKSQAIQTPITLATTAIEAERSDTASKSPYARESPPKGSIGLGFTNSPRRPSTVSAENASIGQRKSFQDKLAPAESSKSDALKDNESSSDSDDESSDSPAATPSKQARTEKVLMPYQRYIAKSTPTLQTSESTKSELSRSASVTLPPGMTLEQFEARKKQHEAKIANGEELRKERKSSARKMNKEQEAQADLALLATTSSKETALSVTPEKAEPKSKKPPAKQGPAKEHAVTLAPQEEPGPKKKRAPKKESAEKKGVAPARASSTTEKTNAMSPAATVEKQQQKKAAKGIAEAASIPSTMASESSKGSRSVAAQAKPPPAAPAVKVVGSTSATPNTVAPGSRLKNLKNRVADKSVTNSPVPQTFAPPPKPSTKKFVVKGDSSDDDDDDSSDENEDLDEKTAKLIAASKPDQSTRSAAADSDEDMDDSSDEDED